MRLSYLCPLVSNRLTDLVGTLVGPTAHCVRWGYASREGRFGGQTLQPKHVVLEIAAASWRRENAEFA